MKKDRDLLERLVAVGLVVLGCVTKQWFITIMGMIYFLYKI